MSNERSVFDPHGPFCGQQVSMAAAICPFCRSDLANSAVFRSRVTQNTHSIFAFLALMAILLVFLYFFFTSGH